MPLTVTQLTDRLVASYARVGGINHLDGKNLPSKRAIALITADLLRLLFPGFFDEKLDPLLGDQRRRPPRCWTSVLGTLEDEISKSLEYNPPPELPKKGLRPMAHTLTAGIPGQPAAHPRIAPDRHRGRLQRRPRGAEQGGSDRRLSVHRSHRRAAAGARAVPQEHPAHPAHHDRVGAHPHRAWTCIRARKSARTSSWTTAPARSSGETTIIGNHVKMYQGVGLVAKSLAAGQQLRGQKRHPTIEDRVTIYAGATIMGGDTVVGEGSTIGANVFLTTSVPPHSLVVQEEANVKVMNKKERLRPARRLPHLTRTASAAPVPSRARQSARA